MCNQTTALLEVSVSGINICVGKQARLSRRLYVLDHHKKTFWLEWPFWVVLSWVKGMDTQADQSLWASWSPQIAHGHVQGDPSQPRALPAVGRRSFCEGEFGGLSTLCTLATSPHALTWHTTVRGKSVPQRKPCMSTPQRKTLHAATETQHGQVNRENVFNKDLVE